MLAEGPPQLHRLRPLLEAARVAELQHGPEAAREEELRDSGYMPHQLETALEVAREAELWNLQPSLGARPPVPLVLPPALQLVITGREEAPASQGKELPAGICSSGRSLAQCPGELVEPPDLLASHIALVPPPNQSMGAQLAAAYGLQYQTEAAVHFLGVNAASLYSGQVEVSPLLQAKEEAQLAERGGVKEERPQPGRPPAWAQGDPRVPAHLHPGLQIGAVGLLRPACGRAGAGWSGQLEIRPPADPPPTTGFGQKESNKTPVLIARPGRPPPALQPGIIGPEEVPPGQGMLCEGCRLSGRITVLTRGGPTCHLHLRPATYQAGAGWSGQLEPRPPAAPPWPTGFVQKEANKTPVLTARHGQGSLRPASGQQAPVLQPPTIRQVGAPPVLEHHQPSPEAAHIKALQDQLDEVKKQLEKVLRMTGALHTPIVAARKAPVAPRRPRRRRRRHRLSRYQWPPHRSAAPSYQEQQAARSRLLTSVCNYYGTGLQQDLEPVGEQSEAPLSSMQEDPRPVGRQSEALRASLQQDVEPVDKQVPGLPPEMIHSTPLAHVQPKQDGSLQPETLCKAKLQPNKEPDLASLNTATLSHQLIAGLHMHSAYQEASAGRLQLGLPSLRRGLDARTLAFLSVMLAAWVDQTMSTGTIPAQFLGPSLGSYDPGMVLRVAGEWGRELQLLSRPDQFLPAVARLAVAPVRPPTSAQCHAELKLPRLAAISLPTEAHDLVVGAGRPAGEQAGRRLLAFLGGVTTALGGEYLGEVGSFGAAGTTGGM
jgi:hypothetical protein